MNRSERRAQKLVMVEGTVVEADALHIAERVHEYDRNLTVQYLEQAAHLNEPPFRVIEHCRDGIDRVAFTAWALDERLLQRVYAGDNDKHDVDALITAANRKAKDAQLAASRESMDEANDITKFIIKSPKTRYTVRLNDRHGQRKVTFE